MKPSYIGMVCISVAMCPIITPPFYHIYGAGGGDDFIVYARAVFPWGRNLPNQVTLCIVVFMGGWLGFATSLLFISLASTGTRYGRFCGPPGRYSPDRSGGYGAIRGVCGGGGREGAAYSQD